MALDRSQVDAAITSNIFTNIQELITGDILQSILLAISNNYFNIVDDADKLLAIGNPVANGGAPTSILFVDAVDKLAQDANFQWDYSTSSLKLNGSFFAKQDNQSLSIGANASDPGMIGAGNSIVGVQAGPGLNNTATKNTLFGNGAGLNIVAGSYNTLLGANSNTATSALNSAIAIGFSAIAKANNQLVIGGDDGSGHGFINDAYFGNGVSNAAPVSIAFHPTDGLGANIVGANFSLASGRGTGTGTPGNLLILTATVGASGSTLQTLTTHTTFFAGGDYGLAGQRYTFPTSQTANGLLQTNGSGVLTWTAASGFEPAITVGTTAQYWRGDKTFQNLNAAVIASTLTGYISGAGTILSSDSILQAIQKLNGNTAALVTGVSSVFSRSGAVTAQSGDYNTSQVTENTNLYYTQARFDTAFAAKSTTNLTEGGNLYFTNARVLTVPLTGFSATNNIIVASDTVLQGFNKAQGQINTILTTYLPLSGGTMTGFLTLSADPVNALHAATKGYIDNLLTGITWKNAANCATTGNITLSGEQTIDGFTTNVSRVLVKNQTTATQNGLYLTGAPVWTRTTDADSASEIQYATVFVESGTINANTQWTCTNSTTIIIGTTNITFGQIAGAGTYTNGTYLKLVGNAFDIDFTTFSTTQITEGSSLYYLDSRARAAIVGTTNRIAYNSTTGVIDISSSYVGQASITTLGTISTGTIGTGAVIGGATMTLGSDATGDIYFRNGSGVLTRLGIGGAGTVLHGGVTPGYSAVALTTDVSGVLPSSNGGTGINNGSNTITLGNNLITSGNFPLTLTQTATTNVTLPTTGTLATLAGAETFTNKISVSSQSFISNGTAGAGFHEFVAQSSNASAPGAAGFRLFAGATGSFNWARKNGADTFVRTFDAILTADRTYTLQDVASTIAMYSNKLSVFAATTSAELAGVISDETGSGVLVFGTTPTFTTSIIAPLVYGSASSGGNLTIQSTSHATKGQILFGNSMYDEVNNRLGIGITPQGLVDIYEATSATNFRVYLGNGSIAHGMTTLVPTTTYGSFGPSSTTNGGLVVNGYSASAGAGGLVLQGVIGNASPTAGVAAVQLRGSKKSGTTNGALGATDTLLTITNAGTVEFTMLANGNMTLVDAATIAFGTIIGTKIGTATDQKIGFFNATPIVQVSAIASPAGGIVVDTQARTAIDLIRAALKNLGLTA